MCGFSGAALSGSTHQSPGRMCKIPQAEPGPVRVGVSSVFSFIFMHILIEVCVCERERI